MMLPGFANIFNKVRKRLWRRSLQSKLLTRWQLNGDFLSVQHQTFTYRSLAIERIADNRMADTVKMDTELMQSSGQRIRPNERVRLESLDHREVSQAGLSAGHIYCYSTGAKSPQRLINPAGLLLDTSVHDSKVGFFDGSAGKLSAEMPMRLRIFGKDNYAAGLFIQPMHHVYFVPPFRRKLRKDAGCGFFPLGYGGQALWLIDRNNIVIFKKDRQHYRLSLDLPALRLAGLRYYTFRPESIIKVVDIKRKYNKIFLVIL